MPSSPRVVALLLSGGAGARLWPVSRTARPKQFLKLFGDLSLYQLTLKRLAASGVTDIMVAANHEHEALLREQAGEVGMTPLLALEPARRDSAPAIAAGVALAMARFGADAVVCALPCDHLIPETARFARTLASAVALARLGYLATLGIAPTAPSSEYGYLQRGAAIPGHRKARQVLKFHEKPQPALAARYLVEGGYDWNSGMFIFPAGLFAAEAARLMPEVWNAASAAVAGAETRGDAVALAAEAFAGAPKISIDYALFEKSDRVAMIPADFRWSDVGNWASVYDNLDKTEDGNATTGDVTTRDARNNLVVSEGPRVVLIGVSDLIVVARPDGVFVAPRARAAEVKDLVG